MAGKFEIYQDKAGEYRFRLKAGNGETILTSEGYTTRSAVENGVASHESLLSAQKDLLNLERKLAASEGDAKREKDLIKRELKLAEEQLSLVRKQVEEGIRAPLEELRVQRYILSLRRELAR